MTISQKQLIQTAINKFADLAHIDNKQLYEDFVEKLAKDDMNKAIDIILVSLNSFLKRNRIIENDILENANLIIALDPEHYKNTEDLMKRFKEIQKTNAEIPKTSLEKNHQLALETFDAFNQLIQNKFDCFYTGGFAGYISNNAPLTRYHYNLDLLINEAQIENLQTLLAQNPDFNFINNMKHKEKDGNEFSITYKNTPIIIQLHLFERLAEQKGIILKNYFYENNDPSKNLFVHEYQLTPENVMLAFSSETKTHNSIPYKSQSLEEIYDINKHLTSEDIQDAKAIQNNINFNKLEQLQKAKQHMVLSFYQNASDSVVAKIEKNSKQQDFDNSDYQDR